MQSYLLSILPEGEFSLSIGIDHNPYSISSAIKLSTNNTHIIDPTDMLHVSPQCCLDDKGVHLFMSAIKLHHRSLPVPS
jgi:hypothetical protein